MSSVFDYKSNIIIRKDQLNQLNDISTIKKGINNNKQSGVSFLFNHRENNMFDQKPNKTYVDTKDRVFGCNYPPTKDIPIKITDKPLIKSTEIKPRTTSHLFNKSSIIF
jgi:hypothetical protein